jgi:hypothetical protein
MSSISIGIPSYPASKDLQLAFPNYPDRAMHVTLARESSRGLRWARSTKLIRHHVLVDDHDEPEVADVPSLTVL